LTDTRIEPRRYSAVTRRDLARLPQLRALGEERLLAMRALSAVLPFRVNSYVIDELIDWDNIPDDPLFQLTFPQEGMLDPEDFRRLVDLVRKDAPAAEIQALARDIRLRMNPHPAGQRELNVPRLDGEPVPGLQHKYRETVLFFPGPGQTCHAYCTYCFRWAQFVGMDELKFASREAERLVRYVERHPEVSSVLITGGDPLVMKTRVLARYIEPLLRVESIRSIRIGTRALAWWPYRFVTDDDADDLMRLFERVRRAGKHLALMAHVSHPRELQPRPARVAIRRVQEAGAVIRCQAPVIRHVNDDPATWAEMWREEVHLGMVPYYMFVERDTGPKRYFELPLARVLEIFQEAYRQVSGLARTVRGPSMSATPGKVLVQGTARIRGEKVFVLGFLQGRNPEWVGRPFFARYDERATWLDELVPALGEPEFFFEPEMRRLELVAGLRPAPLRETAPAHRAGRLPRLRQQGRPR